ncbi:hypothetical protein HP062_16455 [Pseudomonas sp. B14-6]|uniref:hypothetical protein n=1 Tax=Pseudomonas sp. B14-6 TaxID=2738843 RepID=UPI00155E0124|nr:hypothetical protein [Pseudomonas sp. B14-6]QKG67041.1 hypothetical protein HP062_16455 [Pseudomonas sp. B14-6]
MGNLIALKRNSLHELEAIERLATFLGSNRFGELALQLAYEHPVKIEESYQSIPKLHHSSVIGMTPAPFEALRVVCEVVIDRVPDLLRIPSYLYRHESRTTVPHGLWLTLLERANGDMSLFDSTSSWGIDELSHAKLDATSHDLITKNQAMLDHEFLLACKRKGLSVSEAVESLIAHRRGARDN